MGYHSPESIPIVKILADLRIVMESVAKTSGLPRGTTKATVKDVDDPQERGRVRVLFDSVNYKDIAQVEGAGTYSLPRIGANEQLSHWIDTCPPFKGKHPPGLIGKRVSVILPHSQYQYAVLSNVIHDIECLTDEAASSYEIPNNSTMTRMPIYPAGSLPPPCKENHGCSVIEEGGPMESDWLCICLKREGEYYWVRHADLAHGHAGGNDSYQAPDSMGNRQNPIQTGTILANVFPATHKQPTPNSAYSSKPTGNPIGDFAHWYPAPGSDQLYKPGNDYDLLNPDPNVALNIVRGNASFPPIDTSIAGFTPSFDPKIPTILQPKAIDSLNKAIEALQKAQAAAQAVGGVIKDPAGALREEAISAAEGLVKGSGIPSATLQALKSIKNSTATLVTPTLESITPKFSGVKSALDSLKSTIGLLLK